MTERKLDGYTLDDWMMVDPMNVRGWRERWKNEANFGTQPTTPAAEVEDAGTRFERMVSEETFRIRVREAARERVEQGRRGTLEPFDAGTLGEVLARPPAPPSRVQDLIPWEASTLLTAQRKTGKTTLVLNLARSLLTGEDFLGQHAVRPVQGTVTLLNFEVSAATVAHWAADLEIDPARLFLVNLRGRRNPLKRVDDRTRLAELLKSRNTETLIVDPFGRAFTGTSQNDAGEVGGFLQQLDEFTRTDIGALDLLLTAHAGWNGERTRGSTALEDWADSIITVTRDDSQDGTGERYLRAIGRDVDLEEDRLDYDPDTRLLTLAGSGSRKTARDERRNDELDDAVAEIVTAAPGINGSGVGRSLKDAGVPHQKGDESKALQRLVAAGRLRFEAGPRNAKCYFLPTYPDLPRPTPSGEVLTYPDPPYIGGGRSAGDVDPRATPKNESANCATCGQSMLIVEPGQTTHPGCEAA